MAKPITADSAINLFEAFKVARRSQLQPALAAVVSQIGVAAIDADLQRLVPAASLNHVAALGLRGERVFAVPAVLRHAPALIGYYRMLLGISRKEFSQAQRLGYGPWLAAEESGRLAPRLEQQLDAFCLTLITPLVDLVAAMQVFDERDLSDLTLLTLGPTLQGGRNNVIGSQAATQVFEAIKELVVPWLVIETDRLFRFALPNGKLFEVVTGSDPDLRLDAVEGREVVPLVAIEIKGGGDSSNAHNRAGEAEKSQLKALRLGYAHRWTLIRMAGVSRQRITEETPSSTAVFELLDVLTQDGKDWHSFQALLRAILEPFGAVPPCFLPPP